MFRWPRSMLPSTKPQMGQDSWLKSYPTLILHFSTVWQIFYVGGTCIASRCLWAVAILKSLFVSVQDSRGCTTYEHTAVRVFFLTDNLQLLHCPVTWSRLTQTSQEMLPTRFQETALSEQHWHSDADIKAFMCSKLTNYQRMHVSFEFALKMGAKGMFCSSKWNKSEIKTSWR